MICNDQVKPNKRRLENIIIIKINASKNHLLTHVRYFKGNLGSLLLWEVTHLGKNFNFLPK